MAKPRKTFTDTVAKDDLFKKTDVPAVLENQTSLLEEHQKATVEEEKKLEEKQVEPEPKLKKETKTNPEPKKKTETKATALKAKKETAPTGKNAVEDSVPVVEEKVETKVESPSPETKEEVKEAPEETTTGKRKKKHEVPVVYQGLYLTEDLIKAISVISALKNKDKSLLVREILLADPTIQSVIGQLASIKL